MYALFAFGYALTYGVTGSFNFSLAAVFGVGAFISSELLAAGRPMWLALAGGIGAGGVAGTLIDRLSLWPFRVRSVGALGSNAPLIGSAAALIVIEQVIGQRADSAASAVRAAFGRYGPVHAAGLTIPAGVWIGVAACGAGFIAGAILMRAMRIGAGFRAVSDNVAAARGAGVDVEMIFAQAAFIAGAFGALAGIAFAALGMRDAGGLTASDAQISALAAVALGGLASLPGCVLAAYCIAAVEVIVAAVDPALHRVSLAAVVLVLALACLPSGLLPARALRSASFARTR